MSEELVKEREEVIEVNTETQSESRPSASKNRKAGVTGPIFLITIGVLFLLGNLDLLHVNWLGLLFNYWPVLLILAGLDIIVGRRNAASRAAMAIITVSVLGGLILLHSAGVLPNTISPFSSGDVTLGAPQSFEEAYADLDSLTVEVEAAGIDGNVYALSGDDLLYQGEFAAPENSGSEIAYSVSNDNGELSISQIENEFDNIKFDTIGSTLDLGLVAGIPTELNFSAAGGELLLDLTGLDITAIDISMAGGNFIITLPETGQIDITISMAGGNIEITLPDSMEASIDTDGLILNVDTSSRFTLDNGRTTSGYSRSEDNRVDINVDAVAGNLEVR